ncbi:hypothetical protein HOLleu_23779 [Holothuria leucospilota]|uniref:GIY-YIG domain-containing protein n=1 Tax=Holothuria leucospilota TaxID=206669 RepID=A0A9Q1BVP7_HOLLE|nr:hypothetical protein HOLleu_23779 [Holothuria leucospilota]
MFSRFTWIKPILFERYIYDIVGVAVGPRNDLEKLINFAETFCPFLKFTHCIFNSSVVFLDTELSISDRKIKPNFHFKPTDCHNYPRSCANSIPYSQLLRAKPPPPPITAFKIEKNISKHLLRASQPKAVGPNTPETFPCNHVRCNTCPVVSHDTILSTVGPNNNRFYIHQHFTRTSANVVYVLICKRCNILYVGETKRRLAHRVTEHLRSIKQNLPGFPLTL